MNGARLDSRARFAASDVLSAVDADFDVIASNPPYVPLAELDDLAVEVRIHEPRMALTPGPDGLSIVARILAEARARLRAKGCVILEIGYGQERAMRALAEERGYSVDAFLSDLAGIPRVVVLSAHA
jgi:release factor glutamine methyltransferase